MGQRVVRGALACLVAGVLAFAVCPQGAAADARSRYLIRLLQGSSQFRVRTQAAISLLKVGDEPGVVDALRVALHDSHPAVRAAAARALGRLEAKQAEPDLQAVANDPEKPVRTACAAALARIRRSAAPVTPESPRVEPTGAPARFYIAVGAPATRVEGVDPNLLSHAQQVLRTKLAAVDGVEVAPDGETNKQARRLLAQRSLKGFYIDSSVTSIQQRPGGGTRVVVSLILASYPGRDMRAILNGAATAMGSGTQTVLRAVEGAINGAMRQLPAALER